MCASLFLPNRKAAEAKPICTENFHGCLCPYAGRLRRLTVGKIEAQACVWRNRLARARFLS